jgi:hypothetical protein
MKIWQLLLVVPIFSSCGGGASTESLGFLPEPATCSAVVTWEPPTETTDGTEISVEDISKFTIYINRRDDVTEETLVGIIDVMDTKQITYRIDNISKGRKFFYMTATDHEGNESTFSNILSKLC